MATILSHLFGCRSSALAGLLVASLYFFPGIAIAQEMGQITGVVRDPSEGVIPGAQVTAKEAQTGFVRTAQTDSTGHYVLASLRPTVYIITAEAPAFKKFTQTGVELLANQSLTLNLRMELGSVSETVTVTGIGAQVDTTTATIKEVVDRARVVELPLNGRNAAELTTLVPGTVVASSAGVDQGLTKTPQAGIVISSNGARQGRVSYRLDGGNNTDNMTNINQPFPFPDAVQEFSIQTSNYSAAFGNNAGAVVNVVTRSGTNEFHGTLFGFVRNRVFNARNFFAPRKSLLKRSQFGLSGGGPVMLPWYNGRNRTFFFAGWQGTRLRDLQSQRNAFVPTLEELNGDFSKCGSPCSKAVKDPLTGKPFPGKLIPTSRFDAAAVKLAQDWLPTATGDGLVFFSGGAIRRDTDDGVIKMDHQATERDRISGRYLLQDFGNTGILDNHNLLTLRDLAGIRSHNATLSETHTFGAAFLNQVRFTFSRVSANRLPPSGAPSVDDFGVRIFTPKPKTIQNINVSGFFDIGDNPQAAFVRSSFQWSDEANWIRGRHSLSFGGEVLRTRNDIVNQARLPGSFTFSGDVTGLAVADFLLGRIRRFEQNQGQFQNSRNTFISLYVQDDFKVASTLTLNLGLRYEPFFPFSDDGNRQEVFRISDFAAGVQSRAFRNAPPGLTFRGDPGFPQNGTNGDTNNLAPRLGFAWDVFGDGQTSIRGGAGVFYNQVQPGFTNALAGTLSPFSLRVTLTNPEGPFSNPYLNQQDPFPGGLPGADSPFPRPVAVQTFGMRATTPISYKWNLAIEHEFAHNWLARVAYVASRGSHELRSLELNPAVYIPGTDAKGKPLSKGSNTDQRRIFAEFGSIKQFSPDANSSYQSLQLTLNKRFSRGFTVLGNYSFSKCLDTLPPMGTGANDNNQTRPTLPFNFPNATKFDAGPCDFDHTHRVVTSYVWKLPELGAGSPVLRKILNGWEYTGILQFQTGDALTIFSGRDNSLTGIGQDRASFTGEDPSRPAGVDPLNEYFNKSAFAENPVGTFGDVGKGRFRGPDLFGWDMGVYKNTRVSERVNTQFRVEFFNAFNHANFGNPGNKVKSGRFARILSAQDPRIIQLGLKIAF